MRNGDLSMHIFQKETEDLFIGRLLSEKNMGVQPPVVILQQANFCNIFILCLWQRIIRRSDQGA